MAMLSLTSCDDPLAEFEDVELGSEGPVVQAFPRADQVAPTERWFGRRLNQAPALGLFLVRQ